MSNHVALSTGDAHASQVAAINGRLVDLAVGLDPAATTVTNPPTNSIRWTSSANRWEKYNGSAWVALTSTYAISISGNAATASAVAWSGVTGKPTTVSGYGITDAITTGNIGSQHVSYADSAGSAGSCSGNAATASAVAWSSVTSKPFNWAGQAGQPAWLWGSNDGSNYYVWNPSNFSVAYAASAGNADTLDGNHASAFAGANRNFSWEQVYYSGGNLPNFNIDLYANWGPGIYQFTWGFNGTTYMKGIAIVIQPGRWDGPLGLPYDGNDSYMVFPARSVIGAGGGYSGPLTIYKLKKDA